MTIKHKSIYIYLCMIIIAISIFDITILTLNKVNAKAIINTNTTNLEVENSIELKNTVEEKIENPEEYQNSEWSIEIPAINLKANISEGTTVEIMEQYVGHFENTNYWDGNIGLAAHNRRI